MAFLLGTLLLLGIARGVIKYTFDSRLFSLVKSDARDHGLELLQMTATSRFEIETHGPLTNEREYFKKAMVIEKESGFQTMYNLLILIDRNGVVTCKWRKGK